MRNVFSTYWSGVRLMFFKWPAWVVVFVANIIFAALIALPFSKLLDKIAGHSDATLKGMDQFDADFVVDLFNNYGPELQTVWGQILVFVFLYFILNIFLAGGLIDGYIHLFQRFSMSDFFASCAKHFWRLFRLALYFIATQIVVLAFFGYLYSNLGLSPFELDSENQLIYRTRIMFAVVVFLFAWIDMVLECAKVRIVARNKRGFILPDIIKLKFFVLRNFFSILFLYLLCALTYFLLFKVYSLFSDVQSMDSTGSIILVVLLAQVYLFFRVGTRLMFTTTAVDFMRTKNWSVREL